MQRKDNYMDKINTAKTTVLMVSGAIGSFVAQQLGGWTTDMETLLKLMIVDFVMGFMIAAFWKKSTKSTTGALGSTPMWKGLCKKGTYLLFILVAYRLDLALRVDYIRTAVIISFCVNELVSIVENAGIMGFPVPEPLAKAIDVLKEKADSTKEGE